MKSTWWLEGEREGRRGGGGKEPKIQKFSKYQNAKMQLGYNKLISGDLL